MDDRRIPTVRGLPRELADHPQYDVLRELGAGGMGVVYVARNKLMDRLEVLKVVNNALLSHPGSIERFLREIRSAAKLNHSNIVAAYSALQIGTLLVFAMEYVEGEDLHAVVKARGPLPVTHACHYVQQASMGLQHAYEKGMVHRDIKPQNLILAREGKRHIVKVLDFGLAKATQEDDGDAGPAGVGPKPGARVTRLAELTGAGQMLGTPGYVAPEQTLDAARADSRADIYSLGCTLYFLLTGQPPYRGKNVAEILSAHQTAEAPPLHVVRAEVAAELSVVVRKMMAKKPAERYQTPAEVVQALSAAKPATGAPPRSSVVGSASATKGRAAAEKRLLRAETILPSSGAAPTMVPGRTATPTESPQVGRGRNPRASAWKGWFFGTALAAVVLMALIGLWASGIIKVKTKNGTIVVENVPSDAEVSVDDEIIALRDLDGETLTIQVAAGRKHQLQVKKAGFKIFGEEVEIDAGCSRAIRVHLQPEPAMAKAPPAPLEQPQTPSPAPVEQPQTPSPAPKPQPQTPSPVPKPQPQKPSPVPQTPPQNLSPVSLPSRGIVVLDDCDPNFKGKTTYEDNLSSINMTGKLVFRVSGLNNCEGTGNHHLIATDPKRGWIWIVEYVRHRIHKYDLAGKELLVLNDIPANALAVDPETGNLWVVTSNGTIFGDKTVVFDAKGRRIAVHNVRGLDIAYDRKSKSFWIAGRNLVKVSKMGEILVNKQITTWCAASLAIHPTSGMVWVAVRRHPQYRDSKNELLGFDNEGKLRTTIALGDASPFHVSVDGRDGAIWLTLFRKAVHRYSAEGKREAEHEALALAAEAEPQSGGVWVVTPEATVLLGRDGAVRCWHKHPRQTSHAWLAAW